MIESHSKIASGLNVSPLLLALKRQPHLFGKYKQRAEAYGTPHSQMTDIWVRYNNIDKHLETNDISTINDPHISEWYPAYYALPQVRPIVFSIMTLVDGEQLGGVLITKLPPGGRIEKHVDTNWHARYYDKYFVPIQCAPGATFNFDDGTIYGQPGDIWWFDNSKPHWIENNSNEDRIGMIVCIRSDRVKDAGRV
jgi:quercetin dioxygenase-like cupin family protein